MMRHLTSMTRTKPALAMSVVETDAWIQKAGRLFTTITGLFAAATAGYNFFHLFEPKD
jgi:hypothetical protein